MDKIKRFYADLTEDYGSIFPSNPSFSVKDGKVCIEGYEDYPFIIKLEPVETKTGLSVKYHKLSKALSTVSQTIVNRIHSEDKQVLIIDSDTTTWAYLVDKEGNKIPNPIVEQHFLLKGSAVYQLNEIASKMGMDTGDCLNDIVKWVYQFKHKDASNESTKD